MVRGVGSGLCGNLQGGAEGKSQAGPPPQALATLTTWTTPLPQGSTERPEQVILTLRT